MTNYPFSSIEEFDDVEVKGLWRSLVETGQVPGEELLAHLRHTSRDHSRTPMQWTTEPNAGFTTGTPWLAVNPNFHQINAASQVDDPDSVFSHYRRLIAVRRENPALVHGSFLDIDPLHEQVFAYTRTLGAVMLLVLINLGSDEVHYTIPNGLTIGETLLTNMPDSHLPDGANSVTLTGWQATICDVSENSLRYRGDAVFVTRSGLPGVEVPQQADLRTVVKYFAMDVQDQGGHRVLLETRLPAGRLQAGVIQRPDAGDPGVVHDVEPSQRIGRGPGVLVGVVVNGRTAEVPGQPIAEDADQQVPDPPGDRRDRRRGRLGKGEIDDEVTGPDLRRDTLATGTHAPHAGDRLPAIFRVGEPVPPRAQVVLPLPAQLLVEFFGPVHSDSFSPRFCQTELSTQISAHFGHRFECSLVGASRNRRCGGNLDRGTTGPQQQRSRCPTTRRRSPAADLDDEFPVPQPAVPPAQSRPAHPAGRQHQVGPRPWPHHQQHSAVLPKPAGEHPLPGRARPAP